MKVGEYREEGRLSIRRGKEVGCGLMGVGEKIVEGLVFLGKIWVLVRIRKWR